MANLVSICRSEKGTLLECTFSEYFFADDNPFGLLWYVTTSDDEKTT